MNKKSHIALRKDFKCISFSSVVQAKLLSKLNVRYGGEKDGVPLKTHKKIQGKGELNRVHMTQASNLPTFLLNSQFATKM